MKKAEIMNKMTRVLNKTKLQAKKHSPEILVVGGVAGLVVSGVMACKATTKCVAVIDETKDKLNTFQKGAEAGEVIGYLENGEEAVIPYTEEDCNNDSKLVKVQTGIEIVKLYAPAVALGVVSVTSIFAGHNILRKRNVALAAAYTVVDKSFKEYRGRVIERFGKELDRELKYNIRAKEIEETVVDEKGKEKTVKKTIEYVDEHSVRLESEYARFFDDGCTGWTKDAEQNLYFLRCQEHYANEVLTKKGYLFLNDVYDMLGIPRTKAGQIVGWIYDEKNPIGDNRVDFGLYELHNEKVRDFVNGYERVVLLDFNVDGPIIDLI